MQLEQVQPQAWPKDDKGRFKTGNSGGGRPRGARNKLSEAFLRDLEASWEEMGPVAIARTVEERPWDYLKVIAGLMPQKIEVSRTETMSQEEIDRAILRATSLLQEATELRALGTPGSQAQEAPTNEAVSLQSLSEAEAVS